MKQKFYMRMGAMVLMFVWHIFNPFTVSSRKTLLRLRAAKSTVCNLWISVTPSSAQSAATFRSAAKTPQCRLSKC